MYSKINDLIFKLLVTPKYKYYGIVKSNGKEEESSHKLPKDFYSLSWTCKTLKEAKALAETENNGRARASTFFIYSKDQKKVVLLINGVD